MYSSNQTLRTNKLKTTIDKIICKGYIITENQNQRFGFETIGNSYPSNKYEFFFFKVVKGIQLFTCITVIFFALVLLCKWYVDGNTLMALFYWTIFSVVTSIFSTMYTKKHSFFNRKFNKELLNLPIDLITKLQNTIIQLIRRQ